MICNSDDVAPQSRLASAPGATHPVRDTTVPIRDSDCGHPGDDKTPRKSISRAIGEYQKTPALDRRSLAEQERGRQGEGDHLLNCLL